MAAITMQQALRTLVVSRFTMKLMACLRSVAEDLDR